MSQNIAIGWFDRVFLDLGRQMRWSFLPPLMVYFSYGVSGLTGIVGTFFVKDHLGLSAAFLAGLTFWVGIPWALKMPLGHLVDLMWRRKALLIYIGAALVAASMGIMYLLITSRDAMDAILPVETWFVLSALLSPAGFVLQDAVADAMSVEAVPILDPNGMPVSDADSKAMHTTMQTLGRFALIGGSVGVSLLNIVMFSGAQDLAEAARVDIYARIYLIALVIPLLSVSGVLLAALQRRNLVRRLQAQGVSGDRIETATGRPDEEAEANPWYFIGGAVFLVLTILVGVSGLPFAQEVVFAGSMTIVLLLMRQLFREIEPDKARALAGTAIIIFVFRAIPLPGPGLTWFEIDQLGFDEQFLAVLSLVASSLTLAGILLLRPVMAEWPITRIVAMLTIAGAILALPNIGLYYGVHEWTAARTGGIVDARFIALIDTAVESPLGQVAMIPMLAWIARNAPTRLKATFFAVMASFTNLALSASSLGTKYVNQLFLVAREVTDPATGAVITPADYAQLGILLIVVAVIGLAAPLLTIAMVQVSRLRTTD